MPNSIYSIQFFRKNNNNFLFHTLLLLFLLLPYLKVYDIGTDIQPQTLIISVIGLVYAIYFGGFQKTILIFTAILSPFVGIFTHSLSIDVIRYSSIYFMIFALFLYFKYLIKIEYPILTALKALSVFSFCIGTVQYFVDPFIFNDFVSVRTSGGRGVTGIAVEPSFYGYIVSIITYVIMIFSKNSIERLLLFFIGAIQVIWYAAAATAIIHFLACFLLYVVLCSKPKEYLYLFAALIFLLVPHIYSAKIEAAIVAETTVTATEKPLPDATEKPLPDVTEIPPAPANLEPQPTTTVEADRNSRLRKLISNLIESPISVIQTDQSVSDRISHIILPFMGSLKSYFLPNGFSHFEQFQASLNNWPLYFTKMNLIMSGYGAAVFQLGFISLPIFILTFGPLVFGLRYRRFELVVLSSGTFLMFINAVGLSMPLFPLLLAIMNTHPADLRAKLTGR